jgi:hypothetical protein
LGELHSGEIVVSHQQESAFTLEFGTKGNAFYVINSQSRAIRIFQVLHIEQDNFS